MRAILVLGSLITACGGAAGGSGTTPVDPGRCEAARQDARSRWSAVVDEASAAAAPPDANAPAVERALGQLEEHLAALEELPREITGEEAIQVSGVMMDGIDEVAGEISDALRARAEDAAEALLTDRGRDGSTRAARGALGVLEEVLQEARPGSVGQITARRAAAELARRARRAAEGYAQGVAEGDRWADRAEAAPLEEASGPLGAARTRATAASEEARRDCDVPRTLAVPRI